MLFPDFRWKKSALRKSAVDCIMTLISALHLEKYEDSFLAPYAITNRDHTQRLHPEDTAPYRTAFQRDRDRIIHSKSFRRLGYKTQVFANTEGDNYRTRLTHSIEVGQIARSVSAALNLNRDYAEALALAHDLGHTPFGHAGQEALHSLMESSGGFEHNRQSLRIVNTLETRYLDFRGLNLTRATLKGMMKHAKVYVCDKELEPLCEERKRENLPLEAKIVDICDRVAYIHHDLEDGLDSNILSVDSLFGVEPWEDCYRKLEAQAGEKFRGARMKVRVRTVLRTLMNQCVTDIIETSGRNLKESSLGSREDIAALDENQYPIQISNGMREVLNQFEKLLYSQLYRNPKVMQMSLRGTRIIEFLFSEFCGQPKMIPAHFQSRIAEDGVERVVADYISGMTDRFALKEKNYISGT